MRIRRVVSIVAVLLVIAGVAIAGDSPEKKREKSPKMANETLQELYKMQPTAQAAIAQGAGYAVFNNMGTNLLLRDQAVRILLPQQN